MSFFFNDTATTEIYTLSRHDALPIFSGGGSEVSGQTSGTTPGAETTTYRGRQGLDPEFIKALEKQFGRSEEHTSELQSRQYLVCRLLLDKKNYLYPPLAPLLRTSSHT